MRLAPSGPGLLAGGVLLGLAWPAAAALARPWMGAAVLVFVLGSLLRVDLRRLGQGLRQWRLSLLPPLWLMLMLPLTVGLLARAVGLDPALSLALLLAAAAPPSSGNAAIARMLGLDADAALLVTLIATALAPVSVPLLLWLLAPPELALPGTALARQIGLLLGAAIGLALLWRGLAGAARLQRQTRAIDAGVLLALLVFAVATMDGVRAQLLAEPAQAARLLGLAFACNLLMQGLTLLALPGPQPLRLALGLCGGNRNIGLVWAGLGLGIHPVIALYFACSQLPIYTLPRLLQAWLRRQA